MSTTIGNNPIHQPKQNQELAKKGFPIEHFKCEICQGYIIDETTLSDCLHPCKNLKILIF